MKEIKNPMIANFGLIRTLVSASDRHSNLHPIDVIQSKHGYVEVYEDDIKVYIEGHSRSYSSEEYVNEIVLYCESLEMALDALAILKFGPMYNGTYRAKFICLGLSVHAHFWKDVPVEKTKTYLMLDANTGYTKIGRSKDPKARERTLQSEKPSITLFAICDDLVESEIHKYYEKKRVRGEWFDLSDEDIENIMIDYDFIKVPLAN